MRSGKKSLFYKLCGLFFVVLISASILPYMISGSSKSTPEIIEISKNRNIQESHDYTETIKIMTLNIAHGRGTDFNQLFVSQKQIDTNIEHISRVLLREKPHIVGFQEADGPSFWSGKKDHINQIAEKSGLYTFFHGYHIKAPYLAYGTAMASIFNIENPAYVTFSPSAFSPPKGFSVGSFNWPGTQQLIDVIILHLDFISDSKRKAQIEEITSFIESRTKRPVIAMGDFNSSWNNKDSSVKKICSDLNLSAYNPDDKSLSSFPLTDKRLDWILISNQLEFVSYKTLQDNVSDHFGVISEIRLLRK